MQTENMKDGQWYNLTPPSIIKGKKFPKVRCWYQVPSNPNEYVVCGVPEGGNEEETFILRFTDRGVKVTLSNPPPHLCLAK